MTPPGVTSWRTSMRRGVLALLLVIVVCSGALVWLPKPAFAAATTGAGGAWNAFNPGVGWLGNYIAEDGKRVYCIDPLVPTSASGSAASATLVTDTGTGPAGNSSPVSGNDLRRMNYAVTVHGQTSNDITAAAVSAYVYNFVSVNNRGHGERFIGGPVAAAVHAEYERIKADTEAHFDRQPPNGSAHLAITTDPNNHYLGEVRVQQVSPSEAKGTLTLTNAVFVDTGLPSREGVSGNSAFPIRALPPSGVNEYRVSAHAEFRAPGVTIYEPNITIYSDGGGKQRSVSPGRTTSSSTTFASTTSDSTPRSTLFRPVVGTRVASTYVADGEELADVLRFSLEVAQHTPENEWFRNADGSYAQIVARASIYGPFLAQPLESDDVPANAPLAFSGVTVSTDPSTGPEREYTVNSGFVPDEPGFYTWVWQIVAEDQPAETQLHLPAGYVAQDRFGQVNETSIRPSQLAITTQVTRPEAGIAETVSDEVTVSMHSGGWLQANGGRIPVTLRGTAYFSETRPTLADEPPADAEILGVLTHTTDRPGSAMSEPFRLPVIPGFVTFQWCIHDEDQPEQVRGMIGETCDLYGQESETVEVHAPQVSTRAMPAATVYDVLTDTAIIDGYIPVGTSLRFSLFKQPEEGDIRRGGDHESDEEAGGDASTNATWTAAEVRELEGQPLCTTENRVVVTDAIELPPGAYDGAEVSSPEVRVDAEGTYWWVETLTVAHPDTGEHVLVHEGACGLPNETTIVTGPTVTTEAIQVIDLGETAHDIALVEGVLPGESSGVTAALTFQVFRHEGGAIVCDASTLVHDLATPITVNSTGRFASADVPFTAPGTYYWVETLTYHFADGRTEVAHVGACGLANERTMVRIPKLAQTGERAGERWSHVYLFGGVLVLTAATLLGLPIIRRRTGANDPRVK